MSRINKLMDKMEKVNTFNKLLIYLLLEDGLPRTKTQIAVEIKKHRRKLTNTIYVALNALLVENIVTKTDDKYLITDTIPLIKNEQKIISELQQNPLIPSTLREATQIPTSQFGEVIQSLIDRKLIESYMKTVGKREMPAYKLLEKV